MIISTNTDHERREMEVKVRCQRCEGETIPEGLYCMNCGYIPDWRSSNARAEMTTPFVQNNVHISRLLLRGDRIHEHGLSTR